jgi:hypothetical protein
LQLSEIFLPFRLLTVGGVGRSSFALGSKSPEDFGVRQFGLTPLSDH